MKGFILAAGFGTRLWPLTEDRTKAAIPFLNRPLIEYSVEYLASHSIRDLIVNLHHQPESIRQALGDGSGLGVSIQYSLEEEILGTSGAWDKVRGSLVDDDFVVMNGKLVTNIDLTDVIAAHLKQDAIATLVLRENRALEHFSMVEVDERGLIAKFAGFPEATQPAVLEAEALTAPVELISTTTVPLMFTGIQILSPRILEYVPHDCFSHSTIHVYPKAIEAGERVAAYISNDDWYEMSTVGRYLDAHIKFLREGSVCAGEGCRIDPTSSVEESVLWEQVTVESGALVRQSVIGAGVRIPADARIERSVVVRKDVVHQMERGDVDGENVIVPI